MVSMWWKVPLQRIKCRGRKSPRTLRNLESAGVLEVMMMHVLLVILLSVIVLSERQIAALNGNARDQAPVMARRLGSRPKRPYFLGTRQGCSLGGSVTVTTFAGCVAVALLLHLPAIRSTPV